MKVICPKCCLPLPTQVEKSALRKLKRFNRALWEKLEQRRCFCQFLSDFKGRPLFGGVRQPVNLDTYDRA